MMQLTWRKQFDEMKKAEDAQRVAAAAEAAAAEAAGKRKTALAEVDALKQLVATIERERGAYVCTPASANRVRACS